MSNKKTPSPVFCSGDYVVYPTHGVGKVSDISKQNIAGTDSDSTAAYSGESGTKRAYT